MEPEFNKSYALNIIRKIAHNFTKGKCNLEVNELISVGWIALDKAKKRYDNTRGSTFLSFSRHCIIGAMKDAMRKCDGKFQYAERLIEDVPLSHQRKGGWRRFAPNISFISLQSTFKECEDLRIEDTLDSKEESVLDRLEREDLLERVMNVINNGVLSKQERFAMLCRYKDNVTLKETGKLLHVSESRISQVHTEAIKKVIKEVKTVLI